MIEDDDKTEKQAEAELKSGNQAQVKLPDLLPMIRTAFAKHWVMLT